MIKFHTGFYFLHDIWFSFYNSPWRSYFSPTGRSIKIFRVFLIEMAEINCTVCLPFLILSHLSLLLLDSIWTQRLPSGSGPWQTSWLRDTMGTFSFHTAPLLFLLLCHLFMSFKAHVIERASGPEQPQSYGNTTVSGKRTCSGGVDCKPGILLPVWLPHHPPVGEQAGRAIVYFLCLMYIFLGVSIIADRFMASIEVITSQVSFSLNNL